MDGRIGHIFRKGGLVIALAALLAGCSDKGMPSGQNPGESPVGFSAAVETTRAAQTTAGNIRSFRVSAVWEKPDGSYEPAFMERQIVEKDGSAWVYSPVRYMPAQGSVDFFAYSPAISSGAQSFTVSGADYETMEVGYYVDTDPLEQEDFMAAITPGQTSSLIKLDFEHMLSSAEFRVRGAAEAYRVYDITLSGLYTTGTLTGTVTGSPGTVAWSWEGLSSTDDYTIYQTAPIDVGYDTFVPFNDGIGPLMILPQTAVSGGAQIEVIFDTPDQAVPRYIYTISLWDIHAADFEFVRGTNYTFAIFLDIDNATTRAAGRPASAAKVQVTSGKM